MNTRLTSIPTSYNASSQNTVSSSLSSGSHSPTLNTNNPQAEAEVVVPSAIADQADQSVVAQHADYAFAQDPVQFPESSEENAPTYAGLGEILGGIAAIFSGAPSASFSPVIEQAQKNLAERRTPQKQEPIEVDTAVSDKKLQD